MHLQTTPPGPFLPRRTATNGKPCAPSHCQRHPTSPARPPPAAQVGNWWYALCAVSPAAGAYYWQNAERTETFRVKMVTSDDEMTTDITVEGEQLMIND